MKNLSKKKAYLDDLQIRAERIVSEQPKENNKLDHEEIKEVMCRLSRFFA